MRVARLAAGGGGAIDVDRYDTMRFLRNTVLSVVVAGALAPWGLALAALVEPEDLKIINDANCADIVREHKNYSAAEQKVADEIRRSSNGNVATNVLGVATLAAFGLGFFSWDDNADAKENLAELTAYRVAIEAAGKRKSCAFEVPVGGLR